MWIYNCDEWWMDLSAKPSEHLHQYTNLNLPSFTQLLLTTAPTSNLLPAIYVSPS